MKQKEKKARNRRTNEQIDKEVISELEKLVAEYGFGNVNLLSVSYTHLDVYKRQAHSHVRHV